MYPIGVYIARLNCCGWDQVTGRCPTGRCGLLLPLRLYPNRRPRGHRSRDLTCCREILSALCVYEISDGSTDTGDGFGEVEEFAEGLS